MRNFNKTLLSLIILFSNSLAFSNEINHQDNMLSFEKNEGNLREVLANVRAVANSLNPLFAQPIKVVSVARPEATPIAVVIHKKLGCIIVVNSSTNGWNNWGLLFNVGTINRKEAIEFAAAHEIGHCLNKEISNNSPEQWSLLTGSDNELYADIFALSYIHGTRSQKDFARIFESTVKFRKQFNFFFNPSHAISARLSKSREFFEHVPQDYFEPSATLEVSIYILKQLEKS